MELALVMPLLFGMIAVLFQFGILFVAYLSLVHATRDIGRYVAVHPDVADGAPAPPTPPCSVAPDPNSTLWGHICTYDVPSVIDANKIQDKPITSMPCSALDAHAKCPNRTTGATIQINMSYDSSSLIFLPMSVRFGPFFRFDVPASFMTLSYDYSVMVEPH